MRKTKIKSSPGALSGTRSFLGTSIFISLIMLAFAWALYELGKSLSPSNLSTNILREKLLKNGKTARKIRHLRSVVAQTPIPSEILSPTLFCYTDNIERPIYAGEFIEKSYRVDVERGGEFQAIFLVENKGNIPWFSDRSECRGLQPLIRLGTSKPKDRESIFFQRGNGWISSNRIEMREDRVNPGEIATFSFRGKAPRNTDTYREYFSLVSEGVTWMERPEETVTLDIAVGDVDPRDTDRLKYINKSAAASIIPDPDAKRTVNIDISEQKMRLKVGDIVVREYMVSTGTFRTPTPLGQFKILNKQDLRIGAKAPHYRLPQWQGFTKWGHGLHALPYLANDNGVFWKEALNHIGQRVSKGCVRLLPDDAVDLYSLTTVGDTIVIQN